MIACAAVHCIGALLENNPSLKPLPASHAGRMKCCRLFSMAVRPLHAIYLELLSL
jgi:hypothetical protein